MPDPTPVALPKPSDPTQVLSRTTREGVGSRRWQRPAYTDFLPRAEPPPPWPVDRGR